MVATHLATTERFRVAELASTLPDRAGEPAEARKLGFVALGSSTDGRSAAGADEMLDEGFGRD